MIGQGLYTTAEARDHLSELAAELGCDLRLHYRNEGMMYVEFGYVEGPDFGNGFYTDEQVYMVALHELGHFAHGHTQGRPPKENERFYFDNGVLYSEAQAWSWALNNSLFGHYDFTTATFMRDRCIGSYWAGALMDGYGGKPRHVLRNGNRHHVKFAWDEPEVFFYGLIARLDAIKEDAQAEVAA
jgi:hypothetical protein